jgi:hypothetical protein
MTKLNKVFVLQFIGEESNIVDVSCSVEVLKEQAEVKVMNGQKLVWSEELNEQNGQVIFMTNLDEFNYLTISSFDVI